MHCQLGALQPRHVHHMTMEAWYHLYVGWCDQGQVPEADRASNRTFRNVYDHTWKSALPMREISQHARPDLRFGIACFCLTINHLHGPHGVFMIPEVGPNSFDSFCFYMFQL